MECKPKKHSFILNKIKNIVHNNNMKSKQACPCCNELKVKDVSIRNRQLKQLEDENLVWYADNPWNGGITELLRNGHFSWACDTCIKNQRAIVGRIEYQTYCDHPPYLAYMDQEKSCLKCGDKFVFDKEEQQYWYEELKFWVQSTPKHCKSCRKEIKKEKVLNTKLSQLIGNSDKEDPKVLIEISQIYFEMEKMGKGKYYAILAKKAMKLKKEDK